MRLCVKCLWTKHFEGNPSHPSHCLSHHRYPNQRLPIPCMLIRHLLTGDLFGCTWVSGKCLTKSAMSLMFFFCGPVENNLPIHQIRRMISQWRFRVGSRYEYGMRSGWVMAQAWVFDLFLFTGEQPVEQLFEAT